MKLIIHTYDLKLRHVFRISREAHSTQPTLIVELADGPLSGYGEATSSAYYGVSINSIARALEQVRGTVESWRLGEPSELWNRLQPALADEPFALCAVDLAAHDLWGKQQGAPVYQLWGLDPRHGPDSSFTIGLDSIDVMVAKLKEMPDWPIYKVKLGTSHDLDIIRELRKHTAAIFRVDANGAWTADETLGKANELTGMGVEFIEQPLPARDWSGIRRVYEKSPLPIIADESCLVEDDVERCHGYFHGINVKLVKCGGLTPARRMIDRARTLGMRVMVGCMTESSVGISAIAQLRPLLDYVDMDGAVLLAEDIASGVTLDRGRCIYPTENGLGVRLVSPS
jgi:L-alanine-DL-glutamate epimerase-like enolase superfamily enzyme